MSSAAGEVVRRVCLLTGASGTIGYAIARALKASAPPSKSWNIIFIGRRQPPPSITHIGKPPEALPYDTFLKAEMTDESSVASTLNSHFASLQSSDDASARSLNRLDLLVNCAGCSLGDEPIADVPADTLRDVLEVNLILPFILSRWAMSKMAKNAAPETGGRIINIGSVACESPRLHSLPYSTSKSALGGMTRALSIEGRHLARTTRTDTEGSVAVCQINPGNVRSAIMSEEEAERREREEGFVDADDVGRYVAMVANLPNEANVLESTVMPTGMPLVGRG